jgi:hypothetical protein
LPLDGADEPLPDEGADVPLPLEDLAPDPEPEELAPDEAGVEEDFGAEPEELAGELDGLVVGLLAELLPDGAPELLGEVDFEALLAAPALGAPPAAAGVMPGVCMEPEVVVLLLLLAAAAAARFAAELGFAAAAATASSVLPRIDGSMTIWCKEVSILVPSGRGRLTLRWTVHSPVTAPCSQSMDHVQAGSSSNGTSVCEVSCTTPAVTSASFDWHSWAAWACCCTSRARSAPSVISLLTATSENRKMASARITSRSEKPPRRRACFREYLIGGGSPHLHASALRCR